jgi:hypothetical protein
MAVQNTTFTGSRATAQTQGRLGYSSGGVFFAVVPIHQPQLAFATYWQSNFARDAATIGIDIQYNYHSTAAAYDGFTLFPASGNITGNVRVYGYQNS